MALEIKKRPRQVDIHFYVAPEYAQYINQLTKKVGAPRGRVLEALIDHYRKTEQK